MLTLRSVRRPAHARWPAAAVIAAVGIALVGTGILAVQTDRTTRYVEAGTPDSGLPAGHLTIRAHDSQAHDREPAPPRRVPGCLGGLTGGRIQGPGPRPSAAPEDASIRALERAGRLAAPCTAPPVLS